MTNTNLKNKWPDIAPFKGGFKSDLDKFLPEVAKAMRKQGLESLKDLLDRVTWLMEHEELSDIVKFSKMDRNSLRVSIAQIVHSQNSRREEATFLENGKYSDLSQMVAIALERPEEELFGANPHADKNRFSYERDRSLLETHLIARNEAEELCQQQEELDILDEKLGEAFELSLKPKQAYIMKSRWGIDGHVVKTLAELGSELDGVTREAIRQQESKAMERLQKNPQAQEILRECYEQEPFNSVYYYNDPEHS